MILKGYCDTILQGFRQLTVSASCFSSQLYRLLLRVESSKERLTALHRLYVQCLVFTRAASTHTSGLENREALLNSPQLFTKHTRGTDTLLRGCSANMRKHTQAEFVTQSNTLRHARLQRMGVGVSTYISLHLDAGFSQHCTPDYIALLLLDWNTSAFKM